MFVNHMDAASIKRNQLASFFVDVLNRNQDDISVDQMRARLDHHGDQALGVTGGVVAHGKAFFSLDLM